MTNACVVFIFCAVASAAAQVKPSIPPATAIDAGVKRLMQRENVQGLALAVVDGGKAVRVAAYGHRNVERKLPLTRDTVMYGASLTKAAFAYMVLQLVDEGRLDLDRSIAKLLPRPLPEYEDYGDLKGDERWRLLTPRIILNHTTGLANFRWLDPDKRLRFHHAPGSRYGYSGEGFYILQLVLEEALRLDVGKEMQTRVFDRFGMTNTSMTWRPSFAANLADGYRADGTMEPHDERSSVSAAGSMDTTIADQAKLWAGIVRGEGLSPRLRAELVRPQAPITSAHQFPTLAPATNPRNADIELAAGLGLVTFRDTGGAAWFKGGHNDSTGNMVICLEKGQRCVAMLANDVRAERIYPEIARLVLGATAMPWHWEYEWYAAPRSLPPSTAFDADRRVRICRAFPTPLPGVSPHRDLPTGIALRLASSAHIHWEVLCRICVERSFSGPHVRSSVWVCSRLRRRPRSRQPSSPSRRANRLMDGCCSSRGRGSARRPL